MKPNRLLLKIYGEYVDGQWSLICLDFSLAAQADTLTEAKQILHGQIKEYLIDALHGEDQEFAEVFLRRRAPLKYWAKWWMGRIKCYLSSKRDLRHKAFRHPVDMIPA